MHIGGAFLLELSIILAKGKRQSIKLETKRTYSPLMPSKCTITFIFRPLIQSIVYLNWKG